jgi:hypothetical protein
VRRRGREDPRLVGALEGDRLRRVGGLRGRGAAAGPADAIDGGTGAECRSAAEEGPALHPSSPNERSGERAGRWSMSSGT